MRLTYKTDFGDQGFKLGSLISAAWSPTDLGGDLVAIFDASDSDSITDTGGLVDSIESHDGGVTLSSTGSARPSVSGNVISFSGSQYLEGDAITALGSADFTIIAVFKCGNSSTSEVLMNTTDTDPDRLVMFADTSNARKIGRIQNTLNTEFTLLAASQFGTDRRMQVMSLSTLALASWADGAVEGMDVIAGSWVNDNFRIGSQHNYISDFNGDLYEIGICSSALSTADRQRYEGYLAHKWDGILGGSTLVDALPGDHPYKSEAP